ncbi:MAG TPA: NAD(+) synthase, partial [Porphyromonadaceae bacterium]|nr:NAD(+) synthase [Porphyromonadaceae bacterium]
ESIPVSSDGMIFHTPFASFGIEICEDLWMPVPPSSKLAMQGADIIFNLSASNELVGKNAYRKSLVLQQSGRCNAAYVYASAGCGESSTDLVFSGAATIAENATLLAEGKRFSLDNEMIISDIDVVALRGDRLKNSNFIPPQEESVSEIECALEAVSTGKWYRKFNPYPFIPSPEKEDEYLS